MASEKMQKISSTTTITTTAKPPETPSSKQKNPPEQIDILLEDGEENVNETLVCATEPIEGPVSVPSRTSQLSTEAAPTSYAAAWPPVVVLFLSCLSVAAVGLAGNAARVGLESAFGSDVPFFAKYNYWGPNSIGCAVMGFFVMVLPPEPLLPLTYRALVVGFCGSFTTFSTWMVDVLVQNTAADAFEHLFIGLTMPVMFFLWGRDMGRGVCWCCGYFERCPLPPWPTHQTALRNVDIAFFSLAVVAAVLSPILVQVYINKGYIHRFSTEEVRMVVLAPAGAITRFLLSVYLNKRECLAQFPLGTLCANLGGVTLAIILFNMELTHPSNSWYVVTQQGVSATLSTVSSLVNELDGFYRDGRAPFAYLYAFISVGVSAFIAGVGRPQLYHRTVPS